MALSLPQYPDPILREISAPLLASELHSGAYDQFFADLKETMIAAPGVGIAAVQVGKLLRVFFVETEAYKGIFVNPHILSMSSETEEAEEGCLSLHGKWGMISRALRLKVEGLNTRGVPFTLKASGFLAKVIQHESDHLDGKMIIDRASALYDREPGYKPKR